MDIATALRRALTVLTTAGVLMLRPGRPDYLTSLRIGVGTIFQNPHDRRSDHEVYANELRLPEPGRAARLRLGAGRRAPLHDTMCSDVAREIAAPAITRDEAGARDV